MVSCGEATVITKPRSETASASAIPMANAPIGSETPTLNIYGNLAAMIVSDLGKSTYSALEVHGDPFISTRTSTKNRHIKLQYKWIIERAWGNQIDLRRATANEMAAYGLTQGLHRKNDEKYVAMMGLNRKLARTQA